MKNRSSVIIIGSGRRVQQDVIPVLLHLGYKKENINIYANRTKEIFIKNTTFEVISTDDLDYIDGVDFAYVAVPPERVHDVFDMLFDLNNGLKIIVDTPIVNKLSLHKYADKTIVVAEDVTHLCKEVLKKNLRLRRFNFLLMYKSAYAYHGIAFVESMFSGILFQLKILGVYVAFCKKGIAIIFGKKNYEKGYISLNSHKLPFPSLSKEQVHLIGGLSDFDSVSYRFLDLKRIGLSFLILNFLQGNSGNVTLEDGYRHFKKSKVLTFQPLIYVAKRTKNSLRVIGKIILFKK